MNRVRQLHTESSTVTNSQKGLSLIVITRSSVTLINKGRESNEGKKFIRWSTDTHTHTTFTMETMKTSLKISEIISCTHDGEGLHMLLQPPYKRLTICQLQEFFFLKETTGSYSDWSGVHMSRRKEEKEKKTKLNMNDQNVVLRVDYFVLPD